MGEEAVLAIVEKHIQRARQAVSECPNWSAVQAEWSRARDMALDIYDDIKALASKDQR